MEDRQVRTGERETIGVESHGLPRESHWRLLAWQGVIAILFGVLFLARPAASFRALVYAAGLWTLLDGVSALSASRRGSFDLAIEGLAGVVVGAMLIFFLPRLTGDALYSLIAVWALITGLARLLWATRLSTTMQNEAWLVLSGIASIAFGVLMLRAPHVALPMLALWIGLFALVLGASLLASAFHLRHLMVRA